MLRIGFASTLSALCLQNAEPVSWLQPLVVLAGVLLLAWCCACVVGVSAQVMCGCSTFFLCTVHSWDYSALLAPALCAGHPTLLFSAAALAFQRASNRLPASAAECRRVVCIATECCWLSCYTHTLFSCAKASPSVLPDTPGVCSSQMRCCLVALHPQRHTLTNCVPSHAEHCCAYSQFSDPPNSCGTCTALQQDKVLLVVPVWYHR